MLQIFSLCSRRNLATYATMSAFVLLMLPLALSAQQNKKRGAERVAPSSVYLQEPSSAREESGVSARVTTIVPAQNISVATPPANKKQLAANAAKLGLKSGISGTAEYRSNGTIAYVEGSLGKLRNRVSADNTILLAATPLAAEKPPPAHTVSPILKG